MDDLKKELLKEIEEFRKVGHKFLENEISIMEFKKVSGGMGVYAQRNKNGFMIRLRIPSGITSKKQMKWILDTAKKYGLEKVHLTTREAIQFHDLTIDEVCDLMKEALEENIYTRGAGGNYPRNVAISPLAGVDRFEAFDVTPYALIVNNHFLKKITSYKLPRKLKVSFSSSNMDCGHCNITDLGFLATIKDHKKYFKVYLGGGLGANPKLSIEYPKLIDPSVVLYHVEAMTKLFIEQGDYENKHKARIRYIVERMGKEEFLKCYQEKLDDVMKDEDLTLDLHPIEIDKEGKETEINNQRLYAQKQNGLYSVYFHPFGGQLHLKDLEDILDCIEDMKQVELRLTMTEGIYIRNLNGDEAGKVLDITEGRGGETHLEQSVSCIGVPTCQIGICESQKTIFNILEYFREKSYKKDVLPRVHLSGCMNSCGIHEASMIGFAGSRKRIDGELKDVFELHINGSFEEGNARLGKVYGSILSEKIPEFLYELAIKVEEKNVNFEEFVDKYENELKDLVKIYS